MTPITLVPQEVPDGPVIELQVEAEPGNGAGPVLLSGFAAPKLTLGETAEVSAGEAGGSVFVQRLSDGSFQILSGAVVIESVTEGVRALLWPAPGEVQKLLIGPGGLQLEIREDGQQTRRLQLVRWSSDGASARRWQLVSVDNEPVGVTQFLTPAERLDKLRTPEIWKGAPVEIVPQFFPREGAVYYDVVGGIVWEIVRPTWAVQVAGAMWNPGYCAVSADGKQFIYDDRDFEFTVDGKTEPLDGDNFHATLPGQPKADAILDQTPLLYATGAADAVNPNQPFAWQRGGLAGQNAQYAGAWVRYHLAPHARAPQPIPAATAAGGPRLSRPLKLLTGGWELFVDSAQGRMRLTLTKTGNDWTAELEIERARVRAWSPELQLYLEALLDPAALPNAWDAEKKIHDPAALLKPTRLEFASDAQPPAPLVEPGVQAGALVAAWDHGRFNLTASPEQAADPALAMAFVPGPEAGIDLTPWSGRNLLTKEQLVGAEPAEPLPRPPDFNQGLMAVELKRFAWDQDGKVSLAQTNRPDARGVMALLPWAEWRAEAKESRHAIHPFHRNLVQEHNELAAGAEDLARDLPNIGLGPEERRRRQQTDSERAVRDRYAAASEEGLSPEDNGAGQSVSHWLPGANVGAKLSYVPAPSDDGTDVPELRIRLNDSEPEQILSIADQSLWLDSRLSWPLTADAAAGKEPKFEIESGLRDGAVQVVDSSAPLVFQHGRITALTAHLLQTGEQKSRLAVILGDALGRVSVWRPLTRQTPEDLQSFAQPPRSLALIWQADGFPKLAVGYPVDGGSDIELLTLSWDAEGPRLSTPNPNAPMMLNRARALTWTDDDSGLIIIAGEQAIHFARAIDLTHRKSVQIDKPVGPFDFRQLGTGENRRTFLAVAAGRQVRLFRWDGKFTLDRVASPSKTLTLQISEADAKTTGVQLLPFGAGGIHVLVSARSSNPARRLLRWQVSPEQWGLNVADVDEPQRFLDSTPASADITNLSLVQRPSAGSGEPNWLLTATTEGNALGSAEVLCWRLAWKTTDQMGHEPRVVSFARGRGHQGSITALSVVSDASGDYVITGGRDGTARVWDPESGRELVRTGEPARFYDNLGVVRDLPAAGIRQQDNPWRDKTWRVDHLSILDGIGRRQAVRSLSTVGEVQLVQEDGTDIQFTCLDLKLRQKGDTWEPLDDDEPAAALGAYGFRASSKDAALNAAQEWPRLDGAPVFPTRLLSVTFADGSPQPQSLTFQGVLANPAALAVERAEEQIPAPVAEALALGRLVTITLKRTDSAYRIASVDGAFHWRFALADQIPVEFAATAFPGRLARLAGNVTWDQTGWVLQPDPSLCFASAFGRLWPLHSCPKLVVGSHSPLRFRERTQDALQVYRTLSTADTDASVPAADLKRTRDSLLALTAAGDRAYLSDAESGRRLRTISGRHRAVKLAPLSAADAAAGVKAQGLIASDGGLVRFWQMIESVVVAPPAEPPPAAGPAAEPEKAPEYREPLRFRLPAEVEAMDATYGGDGLYFLFRCADGTARLWEKTDGQEVHTFTLPEAMVTAAAFAPLPDDWPAHWQRLSAGRPTLLVALGGSDGSVRVYGVFAPVSAKPKVVELRQFFEHSSAISSLSLALDADALELLVTPSETRLPGLALLSCAEKKGDPPSLREVISATEVAGFDGFIRENKLDEARHGAIILFKNNLRVFLPVGDQLHTFGKSRKDSNGRLANNFELLKHLDIPDIKTDACVLALFASDREMRISIAASGNGIVKLFRTETAEQFTATQVRATAETLVAMSFLPYATQNMDEFDRYLMTSDVAGKAGLWRDGDDGWQEVKEFGKANPSIIVDARFGELIVPTVLLRLEDGHLGIWDPDLAHLERTEIEVDDAGTGTFIYAYLDGEPCVQVKEGEVTRVWNLALGKPIQELAAGGGMSAIGDSIPAKTYVDGDGWTWELAITEGKLSVTKTKEGNEPIDFTANLELDLTGVTHAGIFMSGDRPCALVLAPGQAVVVCDLLAGSMLRRWSLPANSNAQLSWVNLPATATAHGDQGVRLWDLTSGILRRELRDLPANQLAAATVGGQPWVVAGGDSGLKAMNLWTGAVQSLADEDCTGVAAAEVAGTLAVIAGVGDKVLAWTDAANLTSAALQLSDQTASAVAVLVHDKATYFAAAGTNGIRLWQGQQLITIDGLSQAGNITSLALAPSFAGSKLALAAAAKDGSVTLWDCYESGSGASWRCSQWALKGGAGGAVALAWTADGPRLLAAHKQGAQMLIPPSVLRVGAEQADPECYLQVKLDDRDSEGELRLLRGVITPGNKLDLVVRPDPLGITRPLHVQSGIIQDDYYGFRVEEPGKDGGRGVLVLWDAGPSESPTLNGALLLEQAQGQAKATFEISGVSQRQWQGPRVCLRQLDFDLGAERPFAQREVLTWRLSGELGEFGAELLIDEQTWHPGEADQTVAGFLRLTKGGRDIQGHVRLALSRTNGTDTITLEPTVFLARPVASAEFVADPLAEPFGITRDDIVISTPGAGLAIDLVPVTRTGGQAQFVTLAAGGNFKVVRPDQVPLNLTFSPDALRSFDKTSVAVPQLAHRLAQGGRLRVQPPAGQPLEISAAEAWSPGNNTHWLLAPLLQSAAGVLAWSEGLAIADTHPLGRQRLQTENVLAIQRTAAQGRPPVSVANLMTLSTLLGVGRADGLVFDDRRVRREVVRTGASGVIVRRVLRADGRVEYAFVNSPFYALDETVRELDEEQRQGERQRPRMAVMAAGDELAPRGLDPRLIWRWPANGQLEPGVLYRPERPTPEADRTQVQAGLAPGRTFRFRLGDLAEQTSNGAVQRLQIGAATAFGGRLPLDLFARPAASGSATFLPEVMELGYGADKPGAMAHHTLRVRNETVYHSLLDFAHREPQMLTKPMGAEIALEKLVGGIKDNPLTISWTETLGTVRIAPNLVADQALSERFSSLDSNQPVDGSFQLGAPLLQLVQRVGERIIPIGDDDTRVSLPVSSAGEGQPRLPELFLVSRADLGKDQIVRRNAAGHETEEQYRLCLAITEQSDPQAPWRIERLVADSSGGGCFKFDEEGQGVDYRVYRLAPRFMELITPSVQHTLQIIWLKVDGLPSTLDPAALASAAKVFPSDKTLGQVLISPFAPKAAAIARYKAPIEGPLGAWRDRTLFFGDAASTAGVKCEVNADELVFKASQQVSIVTDHSEFQSIFLVKYLDEGQVVYAVSEVR